MKFRLFLLILGLSSFPLSAGTLAIMQQVEKGGANETTKISVQDNMIRIDTEGQNGSQLIFDHASQSMLIINHREKSYSKMNKTTFEGIQKQLEAAKKQMEAQMAQIPAAQREMMMQMMGDKMNILTQAMPKKTELVKTKRTGKVSSYQCQISEFLIDGKKTSEFCLTAEDKVKGSKEIFEAMKKVSAMFSEMFESLSQTFPGMMEMNPFTEMAHLDGFPVSIAEFEGGRQSSRSELKSISQQDFDKKHFAIPSGYREQKINMGGF